MCSSDLKQELPNPWTYDGLQFNTSTAAGGPASLNKITTVGNFSGLDVGFNMEIIPHQACRKAELTLVSLATASRIVGYDQAGNIVATASAVNANGFPETVVLDAKTSCMTKIVIIAPNDETILLRLCCLNPCGVTGEQLNPFDAPVDRQGLINEVDIGKDARGKNFAQSELPLGAVYFAPIQRESKPDDQKPAAVSKLSPVLEEWLRSRNPNDDVDLIVTFADNPKLPLLPDFEPNDARESANTRRAQAIAAIAKERR